MALAAAVAMAAAGLATACGQGDDTAGALTVEEVWARTTPDAAPVGAVYLTVSSPVDDELVGADVDPDVAGEIQLHRTEIDDDGTATMVEQPSLPIPAGGQLVVEPLGDHIMLIDLADPLTNGETFDVTLRFATAADLTVEVEVRDGAP